MPIPNTEIAKRFSQVADLPAIDEANPFRARAYRKAAVTVERLAPPLAELLEEGEDLTRLPGIGENLAGRVKVGSERSHRFEMMLSSSDRGDIESAFTFI